VPPKSDEPKVERVTKQERLLTLLSQAEGASIEEMMQATDWHRSHVPAAQRRYTHVKGIAILVRLRTGNREVLAAEVGRIADRTM
jgi:hypothetical protein